MKTFLNNKSAIILTMFCMVAVLISSCKKDEEYEPVVYGDANMRVINTVSGSNAQDFYQGDTKLSTTAVAYTEISPLIKLKAGNTVISFKNTGTTITTASLNVGLETNGTYTAFYYTSPTGTGLITGAGDDTVAPASGKVKVRFANFGSALNNTLNINITGGASVLTGLGFGNITNGYATLDAGAGLDFTVLSSGVTGNIPGANFVSGKIYTVWFDATTSTTANFHIVQQN